MTRRRSRRPVPTRGTRHARERREERNRAIHRALLRRRVVAAAALAITGLAGMLVAAFLGHDEPTKVTGRLSAVRDISFVEGTQSNGGISPVCGCENPRVDSWRGISFAGRQITLLRTGRSPWTEWVLSSADPNPIELQGGTNALRIEAVRMRPRGAFDPRWMLRGDFSRHGQVVSRSVFSGYRLTLLTHKQLRLGLLGPVPIGAWVPFPGSEVSLNPKRSLFPQDGQVPRMVEHYPASIGYSKGAGKTAEPQAYPVGDFLGPDLVLWTDDATAQMPATPLRLPTERGIVTALIIKTGTFSARIGAVPLSNRELAARREVDIQDPSRARAGVLFGRADAGQITLTVNEPLDGAAYQALRRHVIAHPRVWLEALANPYMAAPVGAPVPAPPPSGGPPPPEPYREEERYPPLPMYAGFNVFGPLDSVFFRGVSGHLSVADRPVDLSGLPDLRLADVHGLRNADDQELLSAPLATSSESANLEFRAVGSVNVNGVVQTTFLQEHSATITGIGAILTLLGTLFAALGFLGGMRLLTPKAERTGRGGRS
jgi:hypothetical protein